MLSWKSLLGICNSEDIQAFYLQILWFITLHKIPGDWKKGNQISVLTYELSCQLRQCNSFRHKIYILYFCGWNVLFEDKLHSLHKHWCRHGNCRSTLSRRIRLGFPRFHNSSVLYWLTFSPKFIVNIQSISSILWLDMIYSCAYLISVSVRDDQY